MLGKGSQPLKVGNGRQQSKFTPYPYRVTAVTDQSRDLDRDGL